VYEVKGSIRERQVEQIATLYSDAVCHPGEFDDGRAPPKYDLGEIHPCHAQPALGEANCVEAVTAAIDPASVPCSE
jgi:hypothetical protein